MLIIKNSTDLIIVEKRAGDLLKKRKSVRVDKPEF